MLLEELGVLGKIDAFGILDVLRKLDALGKLDILEQLDRTIVITASA